MWCSQGSILQPLLLIIYVNDICNESKLYFLVLFEDDTNIFFTDSNGNLENTANAEVTNLLHGLFQTGCN